MDFITWLTFILYFVTFISGICVGLGVSLIIDKAISVKEKCKDE